MAMAMIRGEHLDDEKDDDDGMVVVVVVGVEDRKIVDSIAVKKEVE